MDTLFLLLREVLFLFLPNLFPSSSTFISILPYFVRTSLSKSCKTTYSGTEISHLTCIGSHPLRSNENKKISSVSRQSLFTTQTQNKTRQNYYANYLFLPWGKMHAMDIRIGIAHSGLHINQQMRGSICSVFLLILLKIFSNYCMPLSRSFSCHFQAESKVSSMLVSAFHPSSVLASVGSAQTFSISPARRGAI